jgi:hypothetical protein
LDLLITQLSLSPREKWEYPSHPYQKRDWQPWRSRRGLSILNRPLIETGSGDILVAPAVIEDALRFRISRMHAGEYPVYLCATERMRKYIKRREGKHASDFEIDVSDALVGLEFSTVVGLTMAQLGVPKGSGSFRDSDVDVLAWDQKRGLVLIIECKYLQALFTPGEMARHLDDFRGETTNGDKDRLAKHLERVQWLRINPGVLNKRTGIPKDNAKIVSLLVTNRTLPIHLVDNLPLPRLQITTINELGECIRKLHSGADVA